MNGTRWLHSNQALIFPSRRIQRRMTNYLEHQTTMYEHINSVFWQLYRFFLLDHYCSPNFVCLLHDTSQSSFLLENLDVHPLGQSVTSMHIFSVTALIAFCAPNVVLCLCRGVLGWVVSLERDWQKYCCRLLWGHLYCNSLSLSVLLVEIEDWRKIIVLLGQSYFIILVFSASFRDDHSLNLVEWNIEIPSARTIEGGPNTFKKREMSTEICRNTLDILCDTLMAALFLACLLAFFEDILRTHAKPQSYLVSIVGILYVLSLVTASKPHICTSCCYRYSMLFFGLV